ncbi:heterokaryon incompatibility protein-domain-containing protein [Lophiotrema nucula]|uniref:Heterokaryon incompatibility protein-domain-containing protein n=1 Tax=Lophiotrema nucula TaxID=690887 RepID=A0A6A5YRN0_9PLEO|nr:heterokaryon incompatibility protein-domain-containing protein [Lophiotrema nucula]
MHIQRPQQPVFCQQCAGLAQLLVDISPSQKIGNAHTEWWDSTYGKIRSIQGLQPDTCELCRILQKAFGRAPGFNASDTKISVWNKSLAEYRGFLHSTCSFEACGIKLALAPTLPVVRTEEGEEIIAFTSRFVVPLLNPLLVKSWMNRCEKHAFCQPEYSSKDFDFQFRLIDVVSGQLVTASPDSRYVALSYVWGGVKQVVLNRMTYQHLEEEGSIGVGGLRGPKAEDAPITLALDGRVIPRTIRDAIRLCQLLGERYLWVDSLCILQDDDFQDSSGAWTNADKLAQIPRMNTIYGASALTVIAACGSDSEAGLPGVHITSTRSTQIIGKIGDQILASIGENPLDAFWRSKSCERGWTFQEFLLSKRHLIFLPEQVVFHCSTLTWCEDHSLEYVDKPENVMAVPAWTKSYRLRPLQLPDASKWSQSVFFPAIFINQYFNEWLRNFLKRNLTVTSDILFAFDGALSASIGHLGAFYQGLPIDYFCECLHWSVGTNSMHYPKGKQTHTGLTQRRPGFPSWSWTGWIWNVASFEQFWLNYQGKDPSYWSRVAIWGVRRLRDGNVELMSISSPDVKSWDRLQFFPTSAFEVTDSFTHGELQSSLAMVKLSKNPLSYIIIKALTSFIYVDPEGTNKWSASRSVFTSPDFNPANLVGQLNFPEKWESKIKDPLQVIIAGSFFYGPSPKFPDQTDEDDPTIKCLVVEEVGDGQMERLTTFDTRFTSAKRLVWVPIVAVLR